MKNYVLNKTKTQTQAIKAKCIDCICDDKEKGTTLDQITNCTSTDCSLWEWRPLNKRTRMLMKEEKIFLMSPDELAEYNNKAEIARKRMALIRDSA